MKITKRNLKLLIENYLLEQDEDLEGEEFSLEDEDLEDEEIEDEEIEDEDLEDEDLEDEKDVTPKKEKKEKKEKFKFDFGIGDNDSGIRSSFEVNPDEAIVSMKNKKGLETGITDREEIFGILRHGYKKAMNMKDGNKNDIMKKIARAYSQLKGQPLEKDDIEGIKKAGKEIIKKSGFAAAEQNVLAQLKLV